MKSVRRRVAMLTVALLVAVMLLTRHSPRPRVQLLNLTDFHYQIDQGSCEELRLQPLLLILVHSAPANGRKRQVIRETWGAWRREVRTLFLLGAVGAERQAEVELEAQWFGDVIQGNFIDTYRNLTYKHAMALHWTSTRCPEATFLLKADDDIFVNTPVLVDFLRTAPHTAIMCTHLDGNPVLRNVASVWYVSPEEFPNATYPRYCSGCGILYPRDVVERLLVAMRHTQFFWIDDVFVSGIVRERALVELQEIDKRVLTTPLAEDLAAGKRDPTMLDKILYSYETEGHVIRFLWHTTQLRALR